MVQPCEDCAPDVVIEPGEGELDTMSEGFVVGNVILMTPIPLGPLGDEVDDMIHYRSVVVCASFAGEEPIHVRVPGGTCPLDDGGGAFIDSDSCTEMMMHKPDGENFRLERVSFGRWRFPVVVPNPADLVRINSLTVFAMNAVVEVVEHREVVRTWRATIEGLPVSLEANH
mgnify:CR=1 FL=1